MRGTWRAKTPEVVRAGSGKPRLPRVFFTSGLLIRVLPACRRNCKNLGLAISTCVFGVALARPVSVYAPDAAVCRLDLGGLVVPGNPYLDVGAARVLENSRDHSPVPSEWRVETDGGPCSGHPSWRRAATSVRAPWNSDIAAGWTD